MTRAEITKRWLAKLADWVQCPCCKRPWQRTNSQKQDGTLHCCQSCANSVTRRRTTTRAAAERYRLWVGEDQVLRGVSPSVRQAVVELMLAVRTDALYRKRPRAVPGGRGKRIEKIVERKTFGLSDDLASGLSQST